MARACNWNLSSEVKLRLTCKLCRLPACAQGLREWQAYKECKRTIEDFLEQLPLFQSLVHRAMRARHWDDIARATGARTLSLL